MTADANIFNHYAKKIIFISIYVNDVIYTATKLQLLDRFKAQLKKKFKVKLLGKARLILGRLVEISLSQLHILYLRPVIYIKHD